jgi:hypothetical protein
VLLEVLLDGEQRGFGVERIEDGFDHQNIRAAVQQAAYRHAVTLDQSIETDVAETRIVHVRRDGSGLGGRPQYARDEARLVRYFGLEFIAHAAR